MVLLTAEVALVAILVATLYTLHFLVFPLSWIGYSIALGVVFAWEESFAW